MSSILFKPGEFTIVDRYESKLNLADSGFINKILLLFGCNNIQS